MKKTSLILLSSFLIFSCNFILDELSFESGFKRLLKNIQKEKYGKVSNVFSHRKNMNPTHFIINRKDTIIPTNSQIMLELEIGDSIAKNKSDNIIRIFKSDTLFKETWIYKIPYDYRKDKRFPKKWLNKWKESTIN